MLKKVVSILLVLLIIGISSGKELLAAEMPLEEPNSKQTGGVIELSSEIAKPNDEIKITISGLDMPESSFEKKIRLTYESIVWAEENEGKQSYNGNTSIDVNLEYNDEYNNYEGIMYIPEKATNGEWKLTNAAYSYYNTLIDLENSFQVKSDFTDVIAPIVKDISFYTEASHDQPYQSEPIYVKGGDDLTVVIDAIDEDSGIDPNEVFVSFTNRRIDDSYKMVAEYVTLKNVPGTTKYIATITVPSEVENGTIALRVWGVVDNTGNGVYTGSDVGEFKTIYVGQPEQDSEDSYTQPELQVVNNVGKVITNTSAFEDYIRNTPNVQLLFSNADHLDAIEVALSKEQLQTLKSRNQATIEFGNNEVSLTTSLSNLADLDTIIRIEKLDPFQDSLTNVFEFSILQNGELVHNFQDKITLKFTVDESAVSPIVYYLDNGENLNEIESKYDKGFVYGYTDHFSKFVVHEQISTEDKDEEESKVEDKVEEVKEEESKVEDVGGTKDNDEVNSNEVSDKDTKSDSDQSTEIYEESKETTSKGNSLPDTFSGNYNIIIIGLVGLILGAIFLLIYRKKLSVK
ncbi:hypothetical protein [Bacillus sp. Au-Bac7]|uniref:hypothetical protein n=1 Tax=Bacillus sp. Au-Bac7 TaxID=2906458 RepID=UPI001E41A08A|nr:hypothetical protein [Bacillus sp. Au-Bac7]MCE4051867.1 hypothetical protein [Bacillus sp. Au-Bac7]